MENQNLVMVDVVDGKDWKDKLWDDCHFTKHGTPLLRRDYVIPCSRKKLSFDPFQLDLKSLVYRSEPEEFGKKIPVPTMGAYLAVFVFWIEVGHELLLVLGVLRVRLLVGDGHVLQDLLHVGLEAHVDHTVGFVQNDVGTWANPSRGYRLKKSRAKITWH